MILRLSSNVFNAVGRFPERFPRRASCLQFILPFLITASAFSARAQQPFFTDDADVTDKGKFHFESAGEFDRLQTSSFPVKHQNNVRAQIAYGLIENVEISVTGAFLTLLGDRNFSPRFVPGIGYTTLAVKYNFLKERENSPLPALTVSGFVQLPTGNADRGLGSGVADYGFYGVAQKTFKKKNVVRVNAGGVFAGNTLDGA